jgi:hypothetical protein
MRTGDNEVQLSLFRAGLDARPPVQKCIPRDGANLAVAPPWLG